MKNILKTILLILSSILIISCNNITQKIQISSFESADSKENFCTIQIINDNFSKAAARPAWDSFDVYYIVDITEGGYAGGTISTFETIVKLDLSYGETYHVKVDGFLSGKLIYSGEDDFTPSHEERSKQITVKPYQKKNNEPSGTPAINGGIDLKIKFPENTNGYYVICYLEDASVFEAENSGKGLLVSPSETINVHLDVGSAPVGSNRLSLHVINNDYSTDQKAFIVKNAVIYSNAVTNRWYENNDAIGFEVLELTAEEVKPVSYSDFVYYVNGTGGLLTDDDTAASLIASASGISGRKAVKLDTIQSAVNFIKAIDLTGSETSYIYVDGTINTNQIDINDINNTWTPNITITGLENEVPDILDANQLNRHLNIYGGKKIEINGITFKNGEINSTDDYGGSVKILGTCTDGLTFNKCVFEHNKVTATSSALGGNSYGGAFWFQGNINNVSFYDCTFNNNSVIPNNASQTTYGGAINFNNNKNILLQNCTFESNTSSLDGQAISLIGGAEVVIDNCIFKNNYDANYGDAHPERSCIYSANTSKIDFKNINEFDNGNIRDINYFNSSSMSISGEFKANKLYFNNTNNINPIDIAKDIKILSDITVIAVYNNIAESGIPLLQIATDSALNINDVCSKFVCENTSYEIVAGGTDPNQGIIRLKSATPSGGISIGDTDIEFYFGNTNVDEFNVINMSNKTTTTEFLYYKVGGTSDIKASSTNISDIAVKFYTNGSTTEITDTDPCMSFTSSTGQITWNNPYPDDYYLIVKGTYQGQPFMQRIDFTVKR